MGEIIWAAKSVMCSVYDLSEIGARLRTSAVEVVPDHFVLKLGSPRREIAASVRWREGREVGVTFELFVADSRQI